LAVWVAVEHHRQAGLRQDHQALEQQVEEMTRLIATNEQLSNVLAQAKAKSALTADESLELLRLRGQAGVLRRQIGGLQTVRHENRQAHAALESILRGESPAKTAATADYWPQDSWAFKGYATADAALQSSLWAGINGDAKEFLASVTGPMKEAVEEDLKGKSETEVSIKMMDEVLAMKSVRVINREARGDDTAVLTLEFEGRADPHTEKLELKKIGNDWKVSGTVKE
jgi:hypothetical protein